MVQLRRFMSNVGRELLRQFRIAAVGQLLGIAGNGGQRRSQLQRHLGRNLTLQFLLPMNLFHFRAVVDQAGHAEQAAIHRRNRGNRDAMKRFSPAGVSYSASSLAPLAAFAQHGADLIRYKNAFARSLLSSA